MSKTLQPAESGEITAGVRPTRLAATSFRAKAAVLQVRRLAVDASTGRAPRHPRGNEFVSGSVVAESISALWSEDTAAERELQAGKVHNLRIALRRLDGLDVPAGEVFSFWRQVGRTTTRKGYARGRELREGCLIATVGGGLCQLSNALYDVALGVGCEIVERHPHSRVVPRSLAERGRDATVFWNYVDLRWRSPVPLRLECFLTQDELVVRLRSAASIPQPIVGITQTPPSAVGKEPHSCASCGVDSCFRVRRSTTTATGFGRTAFLVDEFWPELDDYIGRQRTGIDTLFLPLEGRRLGKANYAWRTAGFAQVRQSRVVTLLRAWESRQLTQQGAARQRALLDQAARLADSFAHRLTHDATHVVVTQSLLPFLWLGGHLGGRTFDVLATRLPFDRLHQTLDAAHALHPESQTLGDFRAEDSLVRAEQEALAHARIVVTPHALLAGLFPGRAVRIPWHLPPAPPPVTADPREGTRIVFPASTVGRKGVYELRSAARALGLRLTLVGAQLEGPDFWDGVDVEHATTHSEWLGDARAVVLPSFIEPAPRRLLEAVAQGVPVVASEACGLAGIPGVTSVPAGDADGLRDALALVLHR